MFYRAMSHLSLSFLAAVPAELCCLCISFVVSTTAVVAEDEIFDWGSGQQSFSQLQMTQDDRLVMFDPQTAPFAQTSYDMQYEPLKQPDARLSPGVRGQSPGMSDGARRGMFQGASVGLSYLPGWGSRGLAMTQLRFGATFGIPAPLKNSFILLTPSFEPTFVQWDGPEPFPKTLYSASLNCTLMKKINERWSAMASVGPRWSSDGKETKHAVRCSLMGGMTWIKSRQWQFRFGVVYLNRSDSFNIIPYGGLVWAPNDDWKYELMLPMLRVSRRCHTLPAILSRDGESSHWAYFGLGFGGGTWAFQSVGDRSDVANYSEFSVAVGLESKQRERSPWKAELGYVFGRNMDFQNKTMRNFHIGDTIALRVTVSI